MADNTHIEWTDATWNPITGCSVVSPGCTNCYAMRLAGGRLAHHPSRAGLTAPSKAGPVWNGQVRLNEAWLAEPLRWKRPRRIFVCAHGDLFHEAVPDAWIDKVFAVMGLAPHHTFQVLTKRPERMREYLGPDAYSASRVTRLQLEMIHGGAKFWALAFQVPAPNIWLGVSAEDQTRADERITILLDTPAAVRFVSLEPLLGPINLRPRPTRDICIRCGEGPAGAHDHPGGYRPRGLDWIIAGGESGSGARPSHPDWFRTIRDDCAIAGVPFFFKQHGEWREALPDIGKTIDVDADSIDAEACLAMVDRPCWITHAGDVYRRLGDLPANGTPSRLMERIGKRAAGRRLDGVTHDATPGR